MKYGFGSGDTPGSDTYNQESCSKQFFKTNKIKRKKRSATVFKKASSSPTGFQKNLHPQEVVFF